MTTSETICAISTPAGVGGIAVCRVSGPEAFTCVQRIWRGMKIADMQSHTAHLGEVIDAEGSTLDQAVVTVYRAPGSFTGEDVAEISVHGSQYVQRELLASLTAAGCRLAEAGEFTHRAFLAGRFDLAEAEAVADIIASQSRAAHRIALQQMKGGFSDKLAALRADLVDLASLLELELDFSEEDVEFASRQRLLDIANRIHAEVTRLHRSFATGAAIKEGIPVAIVGDTNAGKSSLLNRLLDDDRAIVSDIHGTTRDTIEETVEIGDYRFRLIDTAGLRDTTDVIERLGIDRSLQAIDHARIIVMVADVTAPFNRELYDRLKANNDASIFVALNKIDLNQNRADDFPADAIEISTLTGEGIDRLKRELTETIAREGGTDDILVTNARHAEALKAAADSTARVIEGLRNDLPGDLVSQDIRETIAHLSAITGDIPSTEILTTIFSRFCIGK